MDTESPDELTRLQAENEALRAENAIYRIQLEDMVRRFEGAITLLRVVSGSRVADMVEQQKPHDPKEPQES